MRQTGAKHAAVPARLKWWSLRANYSPAILQRVWQLCILRLSVAPLLSSSYVTGAIDPAVSGLLLSNLVCLQPEAVQNCTAFL